MTDTGQWTARDQLLDGTDESAFAELIVPGPFLSIGERLAHVAAVRPDALAVACPQERYTYAELYDSAQKWARALRAHTADEPTDVPVAIPLDSTARCVIALMAVILSGRPVLPLDPMLPDARADLIVETSGALRLKVEQIAALTGTGEMFLPVAQSTDPAVVFFTSGSTGKPKGVIHSHAAWLNTAYAARRAMSLTTDDHNALILPLSYGGGLDILFYALLNGSSLHVYDPRLLGAGGLPEWIRSEGITTILVTATLLRGLLDALAPGRRLETVRVVAACGEPTHAADVERLRANSSPTTMFMTCAGASEIGQLAFFELPPSVPVPAGVLPVGRPAANKTVRVVDGNGEDVEPGVTGQVIVTSAYLASGYFGEPELTAQRYTREDDGRMTFRLGDLGEWDDDGVLHFKGRADQAVKIGGYLVEPSEVETALRATPNVLDAVVSTVEDEELGNGRRHARLIAHVVPAQVEHAATPASIRRSLRERLPSWMVPSEIVMMSSLPSTHSGKVDRIGLLRAIEPAEFVEPVNPTQRLLASIWGDVLGLSRVSATADFWTLGADSLSVEEMITAAATATGVSLTSADLTQAPTVAELAARIDDRATGTRNLPPTAVLLRRGQRQQPVFAFAGGGAPALSMLPIAATLTEDVTVIGFHASGYESRAFPDWRVGDVVRRHLRVIRRVGYRGPHILIGHSYGGLLALETAARLQAAGDDVALVVLLDTVLPDEVVARAGGRRPPLPGSSRPGWRDRMLMHARVATAGVVRYPAAVRDDVFWEQSGRMVNRHRLTTWAGRTLLFTAPENTDHPSWWDVILTGPHEVIPIQGGHSSILRPPFHEPIATRLSGEIAAVADQPTRSHRLRRVVVPRDVHPSETA